MFVFKLTEKLIVNRDVFSFILHKMYKALYPDQKKYNYEMFVTALTIITEKEIKANVLQSNSKSNQIKSPKTICS